MDYRRKRIESLTSGDPWILDLSKPEYHNPLPPPVPHIHTRAEKDLFDLRVFITEWSKDYGAIDSWPHTLKELYEEALEEKDEEEWFEELKEKVRVGLEHLSELRALFVVLPDGKPWVVRNVWCQAFELSGQIQRGIACIQAHLAMYEY